MGDRTTDKKDGEAIKPPDTKATIEKDELQRLERIAACAFVLTAKWSASGFYDRQDPADALALDEALQ